eukprot:gene6608-4759_t
MVTTLLIWLAVFFVLTSGVRYNLQVTTNFAGCTAGDVCTTQPVVAILNSVSGQVEYGFSGNVYLKIKSSPTGYDGVYYGSGCTVSSCDTAIVGTSVTATFVNGFATFTNLYFTTIGSYSIQFIARTAAAQAVALVNSPSFSVSLGPAYQLIFTQPIGNAFGGEPFSSYPIVAVADRGGNRISTFHRGNITAKLIVSPKGTEVLHPTNNHTLLIRNGQAIFDQLYINEAGSAYQLLFECSISNISSVTTLPFTVSVGKIFQIQSVKGFFPTSYPIYGGEFFPVTPKVRLLDKGGNVAVGDSTSAVAISIFHNPTGAKLGLSDSLFPVASHGIVQFRNLVIDKVGTNYTFLYRLYNYSALTDDFTYTGVSNVSDRFSVLLGPPRQLVIAAKAEDAWAGKQPFHFQPIVHLTDYGRNIVADNVTRHVTASVVPSLSTKRQIVIDTSAWSVIGFSQLKVNLDDGVYGVGHHFVVTLFTPYFVSLDRTDYNFAPKLRLNIVQADGQYAFASYVEGPTLTTQFRFEYVIAEGDYRNVTPLVDANALVLNGTQILDGNGNAINTTLPIDTLNATIDIDVARPAVVSLSVNVTDGEYTVGDVLRFSVEFDQEVVVYGYPYLQLNVDDNNGSTNVGVANFSAVSDDALTVFFDYVVAPGQYTPAAENLTLVSAQVLMLNISSNVTLVDYLANVSTGTNRYYYRTIVMLSSSIRRQSTYPSWTANYTIPYTLYAGFNATENIRINTQTPSLNVAYGVRTDTSDGVYYVGDEIDVSVQFQKDVVVHGIGLALRLDVNADVASGTVSEATGLAYYAYTEQDNRTVHFTYRVEPGANTTALALANTGAALSIVSEESTQVLRKSSLPTAVANLSTEAIRLASALTLSNGATAAAIRVYGYPAVVVAVELDHTVPTNATTLYPDDLIVINVTFSAAVVATCRPVLRLQFNYVREAAYVGGNLSNVLTFQYRVQVGDYANQSIAYVNRPTGLCATAGCPLYSPCTLNVLSDHPSQAIDLWLSRSSDVAVAIGNQSVYPYPYRRNTTISRIFAQSGAGEYGAGSEIRFVVEFTDAAIVRATSYAAYPTLRLNIDQDALYVSGSHSARWVFAYLTTANDTRTTSYLAVNASDTPLVCLAAAGCAIVNAVDQDVDLRLSANADVSVNATGITLNPLAPNVTRMYLDYLAAENYTAGETLRIVVVPSKPVVVLGLSPRILLAVGPSERYAVYNRSASAASRLCFDYQLLAGDTAHNVTYLGTGIDLVYGYAQIRRLATLPTTPMDVTYPQRLTFVQAQRDLVLDASTVPHVVAVDVLADEDVLYLAGDLLYLQVVFSDYVYAYGQATLLLNGGGKYTAARLVGFKDQVDTTLSFSDLPTDTYRTNQSRCLVFEYIVDEGDVNFRLDVVDVASLLLVPSAVDLPSYIRRSHAASTAAGGIDVNLTLPVPGFPGSMSYSKTIRVDGRRPRVTALEFVNAAGVYSVNDTVWIRMTLSLPVYVLLDDETQAVPSLLLETGTVDNQAYYVNGSGSAVLFFAYNPAPGDMNDHLDYHADRLRLGDASDSFRLNGARIVAMADYPFLDAHVWLNPLRGQLAGIATVGSDEGVFQYLDTYVTHAGPNYELHFAASLDEQSSLVVEATQTVDNRFSAEQQLRPQAALTGERVGHSVALQGDIAVVGAPNFNVTTTTRQVVRVSVADHAPQPQVQVVSTSVGGRPAIQTFYTTTNIDETLGGSFAIFFGTKGPTSAIPANANAATLTSILAADIPSLGNVTVSVTSYDYCACYNAFVWTLTFHDFTVGTFGGITTDGAALTSTGAFISTPTTLQSPSYLDGTFTLSAYGRTSSAIPYDATAAQMSTALAALGLSASDISITPATTARTQSWSITFDAYQDSYEIAALTADASGLTGAANANVFTTITQPGYHGPFGISGYFQLTWRHNTTAPLRPNTTALQMKAALEELETINTVAVNRTLIDATLGVYAWTIDFLSYNVMTVRGYYEDTIYNVEPFVAVNQLIATEAAITVDAKWAIGSSNKIYSNARQGFFGNSSGAAFVYQRVNSSWEEVAYLVGNDTVPGNYFGSSVAVYKDVIAVGAVGANMNGNPEIQAIHCLATDGVFQLSFRGWSTSLIPANVTVEELYNHIVAQNDVFAKLYSITNIAIDDWGGGGLCNNRTARITFFSPTNGAPQLFDGVDTGGDLELLTIAHSNLTYTDGNGFTNASSAQLTVVEVQKGTWDVNNVNADPQQIGAVYLYRRDTAHCDANNRTLCLHTVWTQEAQVFPSVLSSRFSQFGASVQLTDDYLLVGAPGSFETAGGWRQFQLVRNPLGLTNERFGESFSMYESTLAIGTPGYNGGEGCVYIFFQASAGASLILAQIIYVPMSLLPVSLVAAQGAMKIAYGYSVSIEQDTMVIGAPQFCDAAVYRGVTPVADDACRPESGGVFVYRRPGVGSNYIFRQRLTPSNVKEHDRLGHRVALQDNVLLASAYAEYLGDYGASQPVIRLETVGNYSVNSTRLGGSFKLRWKAANSTFNLLQSTAAKVRDAALITRPIPFDATALELQRILEADLHTNQLIVTRDRQNWYTGGFIWTVTFAHYRGSVELFQPDVRQLTGSNANVTVAFVQPPPTRHRSKVHLFERSSRSSDFVEELFLSPAKYQAADLCGHDIALSPAYALVGCPNRDQTVHPNRPSGAGFVFDLSLLQVQFATATSTVAEGGVIDLPVTRDADRAPVAPYIGPYSDVQFNVQSLDRNANFSWQFFVADLYDVPNGSLSEGFPPQTPLDYTLLVGQAHARTQFYGNDTVATSAWVDGQYDYRALGDYLPLWAPRTLLAEWDDDAAHSPAQLTTNADRIDESPRETVTVVLQSPGLWPSPLGHFYHHVTIDDGDHVLVDETGDVLHAQQASYAKLLDRLTAASANDAAYATMQDDEAFGTVVAVDVDYGVVFVAATQATVLDVAEAGKVLRYDLGRNGTGTVVSATPQQLFVSPALLDGSLNTTTVAGDFVPSDAKAFGNALAVRTFYADYTVAEPGSSVYGGNMSVVAVGQAAVSRVFVYATLSPAAFASKTFTLLSTLTLPEATLTTHQFGYAVAWLEDTLVVTAPGLEAAYLFHRRFNLSGSTFATDQRGQASTYAAWVSFGPTPDVTLTSSDYVYDLLLGDVRALHRQGFGTAVAAAPRHLVVTAPYAAYDFEGDDDLVRDYDTEGVEIRAMGRGKAYVFYNPPPVTRLCLATVQPLTAGTFFVSYRLANLTRTTAALPFDVSARAMELALTRDLGHIGRVAVRSFRGYLAADQSLAEDVGTTTPDDFLFVRQYDDYGDARGSFAQENTQWYTSAASTGNGSTTTLGANERVVRCWDVALLSAYHAVGTFSVQFLNDTVCSANRTTAASPRDPTATLQYDDRNETTCRLAFDQAADYVGDVGRRPRATQPYFTIRALRGLGQWQQFQTLTATNPNSGDLFGASVAIDDEYIVVGAPHTSGATVTDWGFETGGLAGWTQTQGTAFRYQPTFGDNPRHHADLSASSASAAAAGNNAAQRAQLANVQDEAVDRRFRSRPPRVAATQVSASGQQLFQTAPSSNLQGRYYVSTYEQRPGAAEDYTRPDAAFAAGTVQGAAPVGVLTSEPFVVRGASLSFLVGGGCDIYATFVELLVDGQAVQRVTGACDVRMQRVTLSTAAFVARAAQLRIVDNSSTEPWGFISVDDFRFDWDVHGGARDASTRRFGGAAEKVQTQEPIVEPQVGVAYLYRRVFTGRWDNMPLNQPGLRAAQASLAADDAANDARARAYNRSTATFSLAGDRLSQVMQEARFGGLLNSNDSWRYDSLFATTCNESVHFLDAQRAFNLSDVCRWQPMERLMASDPRDLLMHFGATVALHARSGRVVVGAPQAMRFNVWKDTLTNHPYVNATHSTTSNAAGLRYPLSPRTSLFVTTGAPGFFERSNSLASDVWLVMQNGNGGANNASRTGQSTRVDAEGNEIADVRFHAHAGAVYCYQRMDAATVDAHNGEVALVESWPKTETAKFQATDTLVRDRFGASVVLTGEAGDMLWVGSPGHDHGGRHVDAGAVYFLNAALLSLRFTEPQYVVVENDYHQYATVTVTRDLLVDAGHVAQAQAELVDDVLLRSAHGRSHVANARLVVAYVTSDVTARGIDDAHYAYCLTLPPMRRDLAGCGDYRQTQGYLIFEAGVSTRSFTVPLIDDLCYERQPKFIQVTLSVPGSNALQGNAFQTLIRIDDDDRALGRKYCAVAEDALD